LLPPPKNGTFFGFSEGKQSVIAFSDVNLFRKLTGGSKLPPYDTIENCPINPNLTIEKIPA
jgi:hypothetical protein